MNTPEGDRHIDQETSSRLFRQALEQGDNNALEQLQLPHMEHAQNILSAATRLRKVFGCSADDLRQPKYLSDLAFDLESFQGVAIAEEEVLQTLVTMDLLISGYEEAMRAKYPSIYPEVSEVVRNRVWFTFKTDTKLTPEELGSKLGRYINATIRFAGWEILSRRKVGPFTTDTLTDPSAQEAFTQAELEADLGGLSTTSKAILNTVVTTDLNITALYKNKTFSQAQITQFIEELKDVGLLEEDFVPSFEEDSTPLLQTQRVKESRRMLHEFTSTLSLRQLFFYIEELEYLGHEGRQACALLHDLGYLYENLTRNQYAELKTVEARKIEDDYIRAVQRLKDLYVDYASRGYTQYNDTFPLVPISELISDLQDTKYLKIAGELLNYDSSRYRLYFLYQADPDILKRELQDDTQRAIVQKALEYDPKRGLLTPKQIAVEFPGQTENSVSQLIGRFVEGLDKYKWINGRRIFEGSMQYKLLHANIPTNRALETYLTEKQLAVYRYLTTPDKNGRYLTVAQIHARYHCDPLHTGALVVEILERNGIL